MWDPTLPDPSPDKGKGNGTDADSSLEREKAVVGKDVSLTVPAKRMGCSVDDELLPMSRRLRIGYYPPYPHAEKDNQQRKDRLAGASSSSPATPLDRNSSGHAHDIEMESPMYLMKGDEVETMDEDDQPRLPKGAKGKGKIKVVPELPEEVWKRVFEIYYDQCAEDWQSTGAMSDGVTPLLISPLITNIATPVLYAHPHISHKQIVPFMKSVIYPFRCSDSRYKKPLVHHLTVRPTPIIPNYEEFGRMKAFHSIIHPDFTNLVAMFPDLVSFTLKDTFMFSDEDVVSITNGLKRIRPKKARIELRCWDLYDSPVGQELNAATGSNIRASSNMTLSTASHNPRSSSLDGGNMPGSPSSGDEMLRSWRNALVTGRELYLPSIWLDPSLLTRQQPPQPAAPPQHPNMTQAQQRLAAWLNPAGLALQPGGLFGLNPTMPPHPVPNPRIQLIDLTGPSTTRSEASDDDVDVDRAGTAANTDNVDNDGGNNHIGHQAPLSNCRLEPGPTNNGSASGSQAFDLVSQPATDQDPSPTGIGDAIDQSMPDISQADEGQTEPIDGTTLPDPSPSTAQPTDRSDQDVATSSQPAPRPIDAGSGTNSMDIRLSTPSMPQTHNSDGTDMQQRNADDEDPSIRVIPSMLDPVPSPSDSLPPSPLIRRTPTEMAIAARKLQLTDPDGYEAYIRNRRIDHIYIPPVEHGDAGDENDDDNGAGVRKPITGPSGTGPSSTVFGRHVASQADRLSQFTLSPERNFTDTTAADERSNIARSDRGTDFAAAHTMRQSLQELITNIWAGRLQAFSFVAFDPLASLVVRAPNLDFWVNLPIEHIRVHLPRGVNSLAVFKGLKENEKDRIKSVETKAAEDDDDDDEDTLAEVRIVGGDGFGGGLVHPSNRLFEIEVNTINEMMDEMWYQAGSELPPQVCRMLVGAHHWSEVTPGRAQPTTPLIHGPEVNHPSPRTDDYPSPTYSFASTVGSDNEIEDLDMDNQGPGEGFDAEAARRQMEMLAARRKARESQD